MGDGRWVESDEADGFTAGFLISNCLPSAHNSLPQ